MSNFKHGQSKVEKLNSYLQNGIIRDSITHDIIGFTPEYVEYATKLAENQDAHYTRATHNFKDGEFSISFYGLQTKKDGTKFDFISLLGFFSYKLRFLIKTPSLAPLSPTERV